MLREVGVPSPTDSYAVYRDSHHRVKSAPAPNSSDDGAFNSPAEMRTEPDFYFVPPRDLPTEHPMGNPESMGSDEQTGIYLHTSPIALHGSTCELEFSVAIESSCEPGFYNV